MKFEKQGDWMVGTPVFMGTSEVVATAAKCPHDFKEVEWSKKKDVDPGTGKSIEMVMDRCQKCVALRTRYRFL